MIPAEKDSQVFINNMLTNKNDIIKLLIIFFLGLILYNTSAPTGLSSNSWHLLILFGCTVSGAILNPIPLGLAIMISILIGVLTKTISIEQAFSGFSSSIVWLVVFAFFIARSIIKSNLGKRLAYLMISKIGHSLTGLSYGIIITEFLLAPFIPSASARGGGIMYPVAQALTDQYHFLASGKDIRIGQFLMQLCFQANIITSAMFLTAMAGNPLIAGLAHTIGIELSIANWWLAAVIPGICSLLALPFILRFMIQPVTDNIKHGPILAETALKEMGPLSRNERIVLLTFILLIVLWVGAKNLGIDPTITALAGFIVLSLTKVLSWEDAIQEREAWKTFIWFAGFVMLSEALSINGVTTWIGSNITGLIQDYNPLFTIPLTLIVFFYMHYLFASVTVYAAIMYTTFVMLLIEIGVPGIVAGFAVAIAANLSSCLTQYGITSAPIFFAASHMTVQKWWKIGFVISLAHILIWGVIGAIWWKTLGWW